MNTAEQEIRQGKRFAFGKNWSAFLQTLDEDRIAVAEQSLRDLLEVQTLSGKRFLDVGCGSGLFSLAAWRLGAAVHSFDFDPDSVACAEELRRRGAGGEGNGARESARCKPPTAQPSTLDPQRTWSIEQGSALDQSYLASLGTFDVVYSWGVLHHTGEMWKALENVAPLVAPGGKLAIALYHDQGFLSRMWLAVKQMYCAHALGRGLVLAIFVPYFFLRTLAVSLIRRRNEFAHYRRRRGMSIVHDWIDWLGGLPFEVAGVDEVVAFFEERGFQLARLNRTRRLGNNEFVFVKSECAAAP